MRLLGACLLFGVLIAAPDCGGGGTTSTPQTGPLSGNWQIELRRHVNPDPPLTFTGFLVQSRNSVAGSLILGSNCQGVGAVTGTVDGQNLSLTIDEFGEDISLTGTMATGITPMGGQFSNLAGGCTAFANTGTWSAIQVPPLSGNFHGSFTSISGNGEFAVTGALTQGPNIASSNASISGTIADTGAPRLCYDLATSTVTGFISGTNVTLNLYGSNGLLIAQVLPATVSTDGTSLMGAYSFPAIGGGTSACAAGDQGTVQLTFP